jgi:hypothetical protein
MALYHLVSPNRATEASCPSRGRYFSAILDRDVWVSRFKIH